MNFSKEACVQLGSLHCISEPGDSEQTYEFEFELGGEIVKDCLIKEHLNDLGSSFCCDDKQKILIFLKGGGSIQICLTQKHSGAQADFVTHHVEAGQIVKIPANWPYRFSFSLGTRYITVSFKSLGPDEMGPHSTEG